MGYAAPVIEGLQQQENQGQVRTFLELLGFLSPTQPDVDAALAAYRQHHDLAPLGGVDEMLMDHMRQQVRLLQLNQSLAAIRKMAQDQARAALLSDPATQDLMERQGPEVADPTRDASSCLASPTPFCLLSAAIAESKAIFEAEKRDWAIGDIIAATLLITPNEQALRKQMARLSDSRLILKALGDLALVFAQGNDPDNALALLSLIEEGSLKRQALLGVLERHPTVEKYRMAFVDHSRTLTALNDRLMAAIDMLAYAEETSPIKAMEGILQQAAALPEDQGVLVRLYGLEKLAQLGFEAEAMTLIPSSLNDERRAPLYLSAVQAALKRGDQAQALHWAAQITAPRYGSLAQTAIAVHVMQKDPRQGLAYVQVALDQARAISLRYARHYALAYLGERLVPYGEQGTLNVIFEQILSEIDDARLSYPLRLAYRYDVGKFPQTETGVPTAGDQARILADLSLKLYQQHKRDQAQEVLAQGLKAVDQVKNAWMRTRLLAKFAMVVYRLSHPPFEARHLDAGASPP